MWLALFLESLHIVSEPAWKFRVGSETIPYKMGPNEDVSDLSRGYCEAPI